jgi:flavin-dependent dehydrogenase
MRRFDVAVFGASISGSAAATHLASSGWSVLLLQRGKDVERYESVSAETQAQLARIGVQAGEACPGVTAWWGSPEPRRSSTPGARIVEKSRLAHRLRQLAASQGTKFIELSRDPAVHRTGQLWTVQWIRGSSFEEAQCRYLIDATGRRAFLARKQGARQVAVDELFAISLPIRKAPAPGVWTESAVYGWWNVCCGQRQGTLSFYGTAASLRVCRRSLRERYAQTRLSMLLPALVDTDRVHIRACGSARLVPAAGDGWIAVGDSAWTLQPLASAGISKALRDGARAAQGLLGAAETYEQLHRTEFNGYLTLLREHYALEERWFGSAALAGDWRDGWRHTKLCRVGQSPVPLLFK